MDAVDKQLEELIQGYVESALKSPMLPIRCQLLMESTRNKPEQNRSDSVSVLDLGPCVIVLHRVSYQKVPEKEDDPE